MTQLSRKPIDKNLEAEILNKFWQALSQVNDPPSNIEFFGDFLSEMEKITLAKRFATALLLAKNYSPSEIKEKLHVSDTKIISVSNWLKNANPKTKQIIDAVLREQNKENLTDQIEELFDYLPPLPYTNWHQAGKEKFKREKKRSTRHALR
ncbi:MAG: hypothetical protein A2700_02315 [Candidatus Blackburnbacteria bacterium RIFCSPHIGHO2_01_FULL_44_64]|uniref:TrpR like protein, YerC/YecD n=1 Tax=Candidatus Blackburnbacteria bacterium RIFCSPHIGHO2_02_FULL_44_20 TaxID=1797516 RepID=A0A1G1V4X3_9BACT|nr:MAG: hypothetical protein A2700_02315 [Candidatus Blackburnbacteria bacterium RIFCSPHIGHO2_01_FULL_44_64]OGY10450.1 MAG: hypothetical protein A3D26_04330 [Candidatus Blackburnbacteria bacterium RIFCSPHIGHO2_02_FULL_44_20]OGY10686.1 MAG: hypothetical protein A3E16_01740 [Candidatus Blackburnbacteria bacterium RIFCSPHIGHO2_12_FULL_44_25]OGY13380.1 MAG: hypothetical protein A3A62_01065 [Candidatus Blackburnbacteria bacterium RIFCSPLOWO2_01_FULL_44_43]OGY15943.1 MAG: hypothetical protein A3H88_0